MLKMWWADVTSHRQPYYRLLPNMRQAVANNYSIQETYPPFGVGFFLCQLFLALYYVKPPSGAGPDVDAFPILKIVEICSFLETKKSHQKLPGKGVLPSLYISYKFDLLRKYAIIRSD